MQEGIDDPQELLRVIAEVESRARELGVKTLKAERRRRWRQTHKEEVQASNLAYAKDNPDKQAAWLRASADRMKQKRANYLDSDLDRRAKMEKDRRARLRKEGPEGFRAKDQARRKAWAEQKRAIDPEGFAAMQARNAEGKRLYKARKKAERLSQVHQDGLHCPASAARV